MRGGKYGGIISGDRSTVREKGKKGKREKNRNRKIVFSVGNILT